MLALSVSLNSVSATKLLFSWIFVAQNVVFPQESQTIFQGAFV